MLSAVTNYDVFTIFYMKKVISFNSELHLEAKNKQKVLAIIHNRIQHAAH